MAEPARATPLEPHEGRLAVAGARAIALASQVSVRADAATAAALGLPRDPNTWSRVDGRDALWLGPDEWLLASEDEPGADVLRDLESRIGTRGHHAVIDVSAGRVVIELTGAARVRLLEAGCGIDLHPRSWRDGMCAQTLLAKIPVLLQEREGATRIFVRPSFAGYLTAWLARVAEMGVGPGAGRDR
jgi:sarcosine oxidase, subunit gamma